MEIGGRIRFFRVARKFTQEQLGRAIGASTSKSAKAAIAKIEKGQVPGGLRLQRLAQALGCSTDILLSGRSRELMEVLRYHIRPAEGLDAFQLMTFRVARLFIHCAITAGSTDDASEFVESANRLFYMAEHDKMGCRSLLAAMPKGPESDPRADLLAAKGDLRGLVRHAMRGGYESRDPAAYASYRRGMEAVRTVLSNYVEPEQPPLTAALLGQRQEHGGEAPARTVPSRLAVLDPNIAPSASSVPTTETREIPPGTALLEVAGSELEPLARKGQWVMLAAAERRPLPGDVVAYWPATGSVTYGRVAGIDKKHLSLLPVSPTATSMNQIRHKEIAALRVITGVWFA